MEERVERGRPLTQIPGSAHARCLCIYARWKILNSAAARAWETPSLTTVRRRHAEGSIVEARDKTTHVD